MMAIISEAGSRHDNHAAPGVRRCALMGDPELGAHFLRPLVEAGFELCAIPSPECCWALFAWSERGGPEELRSAHARWPFAQFIACAPPNTANGAIAAAFACGATAWLSEDADRLPRALSEVMDALVRPADNGEAASLAQKLAALSRREREVLAYVAVGMDNLKIAAHLGVGERTVKAHVTQLYRKLQLENRAQLALLGARLGLAPPEEPR